MGAIGAIGAGVSFAGNLIGAVGQSQAASDAASAERANAALLREQAAFLKQQNEIQQDILREDQGAAFGEQISTFAKAGVTLSGSPLLVLTGTKVTQSRERKSLKLEGEIQVRNALLQAGAADASAGAFDRQSGTLLAGGFLAGAGGLASDIARLRTSAARTSKSTGGG